MPRPLRDAAFRRRIRDAAGWYATAMKNRSRGAAELMREDVMSKQKFTPKQAWYAPWSVYAFATCGSCIFYVPDPQGSSTGSCRVVDGPIEREGVCSFWSLRARYPGWFRIGTVRLHVGRGPPEKPAPAHDLIYRLGGQYVYTPPPGKAPAQPGGEGPG